MKYILVIIYYHNKNQGPTKHIAPHDLFQWPYERREEWCRATAPGWCSVAEVK